MKRQTKADLAAIIEELEKPLCVKRCSRCGAGISAIVPTHKERGPWQCTVLPDWQEPEVCCAVSGKTITDAVERWNQLQGPEAADDPGFGNHFTGDNPHLWSDER